MLAGGISKALITTAAGQAKTAVCGACHGPDGNSMAPNFPKLAGQGDRYLLKQLHETELYQVNGPVNLTRLFSG